MSDNPFEKRLEPAKPLFYLFVVFLVIGIILACWSIYLFATAGEPAGSLMLTFSAVSFLLASAILVRLRSGGKTT